MEQHNLTLGSLFDGSGGFPLDGMLAGITPVWASEIEPFPIRVTTKRLPFVRHYGDVSQMDGATIEPVDIITFGSPCQDMSIAGKREGLDGQRSGLFYEAIRVIKEMREATDGKQPRFIVWENVPGAFSSNKGEDFKAVLDAIRRVKDSEADTPRPERWANAGCVLADDYSVAWRVLDAQFWGVPQRRKRIYLVADFGGKSAGKILFESEGVSGYSAAGFRAWQEAAGSVGEGAQEAGVVCLNDQGGQKMDVSIGITGTLRAKSGGHQPLVAGAVALENHPIDGRLKPCADGKVQTLTSRMGTGGMNVPCVMETFDVRFTSEGTKNARQNVYATDTSRALCTGHNAPDSNQGGIAIVAVEADRNQPVIAFSDKAAALSAMDGPKGPSSQQFANPAENFVGVQVVALEGNGARPSHHGDGYAEGEVSFTLNATEQHGVAYGIDRAAYNMGQNARFGLSVEKEVEPTLVAKGPGATCAPVYHASKNSLDTSFTDEAAADTLVAVDYKDPPSVAVCPDYLVRRLTPTECARLQGFPDWWCRELETEEPTDEELVFWREVFETHRKIAGTSTKPKTDKQIIKWLKSPHTDAAEYKLWGNGVALPCVAFVMAGIVYWAQFHGKEV